MGPRVIPVLSDAKDVAEGAGRISLPLFYLVRSRDSVSPCRPCWPQAHGDPPCLCLPVLGLKVSASVLASLNFLWEALGWGCSSEIESLPGLPKALGLVYRTTKQTNVAYWPPAKAVSTRNPSTLEAEAESQGHHGLHSESLNPKPKPLHTALRFTPFCRPSDWT